MRLNKASAWLALSLSIMIPMGQIQASQLSVESALNELQYSLTVEIDPKASNAAELQKAAYKKFAEQIDQLKKQGLSDEQIVEASIKANAIDAETAKSAQKYGQMVKSGKISQKEMAKKVRDAAVQNQTQGASWSGVGTGIVVGVVVVAIVIALLTADNVTVTTYDPYYDCYYDYYWDEYTCYYY